MPSSLDRFTHRVVETQRCPIRFNTVTGKWSLYWRDRNSKWHPFDLVEPGTIDEMLATLDEDSMSIFWG